MKVSDTHGAGVCVGWGWTSRLEGQAPAVLEALGKLNYELNFLGAGGGGSMMGGFGIDDFAEDESRQADMDEPP